MQEIEFPIVRINSDVWIDYEEFFPLFNGYLYSSKEEIFNIYFFHKEFIDINGNIFKVVGREATTNFFRIFFRFIPNIYREKLIFEKVDKIITLDNFKEDLIKGIKKFDSSANHEVTEELITEIRNAKSFKEVICGEK